MRCGDMRRRASASRGRDRATRSFPLSFAPGEAYQFDWSHEIVVLRGAHDRDQGGAGAAVP